MFFEFFCYSNREDGKWGKDIEQISGKRLMQEWKRNFRFRHQAGRNDYWQNLL